MQARIRRPKAPLQTSISGSVTLIWQPQTGQYFNVPNSLMRLAFTAATQNDRRTKFNGDERKWLFGIRHHSGDDFEDPAPLFVQKAKTDQFSKPNLLPV